MNNGKKIGGTQTERKVKKRELKKPSTAFVELLIMYTFVQLLENE